MVEQRIGGDPDLSTLGVKYSKALAQFIQAENIPNMRLWTSLKKRTIQTAQAIDAPQKRWKELNEIEAVTFLYKKWLLFFWLRHIF